MALSDEKSSASRATPDDAPPPEGTGHSTDSPSGSTGTPGPARRNWLIVLAAGLLAGLASFGIGEAAPALVPHTLELSPEIRADRSRVPLETERQMRASRDRAAALAYGGLGLLLGLALGLAGGL